MTEYSNINILVVDDDKVDVLAIRQTLEDNRIANPVHAAGDGVEALEMLRSRTNGRSIRWPVLILLDLNMPRMNGIEFLQQLRADPKLHNTVVFVLTTSKDEKDKIAAYNHHVAGYMVKSEVGHEFINLVRLLNDYRLIVQFPALE